MIYLVTFLSCFFADYLRKLGQIRIYNIILCWVYIFLCFGYMVGTDWRAYELTYSYSFDELNDLYEKGFVYLVVIARNVISDFWIFNALTKIIFVHSLLNFFSNFTREKLSALAISFCFLTPFMTINCPMRFMIAMSFVLYSIKYMLNKEWKKCLLLLAISVSFHVMMVFNILVILLLNCFRKQMSSLSSVTIFVIFVICQVLTTISQNYEDILSVLSDNPMLNYYARSYGDFSTQDFKSIGSIKTIIFFLFFLWNRKSILRIKHGELLFNALFLSYTLGSIVSIFPTCFRLNIFMGYFSCVTMTILLLSREFKINVLKVGVKYILVLLLSIIVLKDAYGSYAYYPYSNSIKYIFTGHLPYSYRDSYNIIQWNKRFRE